MASPDRYRWTTRKMFLDLMQTPCIFPSMMANASRNEENFFSHIHRKRNEGQDIFQRLYITRSPARQWSLGTG
ncbi:hypothetical protein ARMGADRAFT_572824 [Armillaria gallica]|uniref:Uncharacterized protein n=1 Tax=Armillaria gallica TaxID=47427 RepID=A0A2H3DWN4_ARMGA|nr:hypothetical protein ARMGADRAFT_572824 [Armillaria gallica]